jgi:two-component system CitB family sensor kinase
VRFGTIMGRVRLRRLSTQIFALQAAILVATLLIGFALAIGSLQSNLDREFEQRALAIAHSVSADPVIADAAARRDDSGLVQRRAEAVRRATGASFVVVTDDKGIRLSHPNPEQIGHRVSTDPTAVLSGHIFTGVETGTLGRSARGKVPLRIASGRIVGEVSVGVLEDHITSALAKEVPRIALYSGIALAVGLVASILLAAHLKRRTFGLELDEIVDLLREREAMLYGIREGVIAVGPAGELRLINDEGRRLLDLDDVPVGGPVAELVPPGRLADVLAGRIEGRDLVLVRDDRILLVNRVEVRLRGRDLGAVVTIRDRTELEDVLRELNSTRSLADAMRAQAHEFSNRMHTLVGLLELGQHDAAVELAIDLSFEHNELTREMMERISDPFVAALLLAKGAAAAERGVELRFAEGLELEGELVDARDVLSVLGNLVDNAIDAAAQAGGKAWVEVLLRGDGDAVVVRVADSGSGVPPELRERIFQDGFSTKATSSPAQRGVGLALVRQLVERRGGHVRLLEPEAGARGHGAVFEAVLPEAQRVPAEVRV